MGFLVWSNGNAGIIENKLNQLIESGDLTAFSQHSIKDMVNVIVAILARHNELIVEGVKSVMGGKILNYEAKDILNRGRQEGRQEGRFSVLYSLVEEGFFPWQMQQSVRVYLNRNLAMV